VIAMSNLTRLRHASFTPPDNGFGQPLRNLGGLVILPGDVGQWSARDKQLGTTGRRLGDPEYGHYVLKRGVINARSLAHDHLVLLTKKERAAWDYCLLHARKHELGQAALLPAHIPAEIRRMPGKEITQVVINLGWNGLIDEPRWLIRLADGEMLGGSLEAPPKQQRRETHIQHGTVVHHHHGAPQHVHHGTPADQRAIADADHVLRNFRSTW
jgi:hypothetical protein